MVHGLGGGMGEAVCSCCQLLPLLLLEPPIFLVSISLSPTPVMTVELLMVAAISMGSFSIRKLVQKVKVRTSVNSAVSIKLKVAQKCFHLCQDCKTAKSQIPGNSDTKKTQGGQVILLKSVDYKVFNKSSKTNLGSKKTFFCHCK